MAGRPPRPAPGIPSAPPPGLRAIRLGVGPDAPVALSFPLPKAPCLDRLTKAEREVLRLLLDGHSTRSIAAQRGTRPRTVDKQVQAIYVKLGVHSRAELAAL